MDIAALSTQMSMTRVQNSVGITMMKKVMDQQEQTMANMVAMMETATPAAPPSEHLLDITV